VRHHDGFAGVDEQTEKGEPTDKPPDISTPGCLKDSYNCQLLKSCSSFQQQVLIHGDKAFVQQTPCALEWSVERPCFVPTSPVGRHGLLLFGQTSVKTIFQQVVVQLVVKGVVDMTRILNGVVMTSRISSSTTARPSCWAHSR